MLRIILGLAMVASIALAGCLDLGAPAPQPPPEPAPQSPGPIPQNYLATDEYDAEHHRLFVHGGSNALTSIELATGTHHAVPITWPWPESASGVGLRHLVTNTAGNHVFAVTVRDVMNPSDPQFPCRSSDLVSIDAGSGEATLLKNILYSCCDDCHNHKHYYSPQVDTEGEQLLALEMDCTEELWLCDSYLQSNSLVGDGGSLIRPVFEGDCPPGSSESSCEAELQPTHGVAMVLDPWDPSHKVLVLLDDATVDAIDFTTGARETIATIQTRWNDHEIDHVDALNVDVARQRLLVSAHWRTPEYDWFWMVVAVDLLTGEQTLLYDGNPTADGERLESFYCRIDTTFDARENRLFLVEYNSGSCPESGRIFAVDIETGALTRMPFSIFAPASTSAP